MRNVCLVGCIAALTLALVSVPASAGGPHPGSALAQTTASGIDVAGVIETVSHRLERTKGGTLTSADRLYRASFDDSGFAIRLRGAGSLRLRTSRALVGRSRLAVAPGAWRAERNRAERTLAHGLAERVTARSGHLEWDFVLDRPPAQTGALAIEARVSAGSTGKALRFPVGAGRAVTIGELVVRDARGRRLYHALPEARRPKARVGSARARPARGPLSTDDRSRRQSRIPGLRAVQRRPTRRPVPPQSRSTGRTTSSSGPTSGRTWTPTSTARESLLPGRSSTPTGSRLRQSRFRKGRPLSPSMEPTTSSSGQRDRVAFSTLHASVPGASFSIPTRSRSRAATDSQFEPSVAFDGTNYLVAWRRRAGGGRRRRRRHLRGPCDAGRGSARPGWSPKSSSGRAHSATQRSASTARTPGRLERRIFGRRRRLRSNPGASPAGAVLDPESIRIPAAGWVYSEEEPAVASDGEHDLVVFVDEPGRARAMTFTERASALMESSSIPKEFRSSTQAGNQFRPNLAFDGTNYLVVWNDCSKRRQYYIDCGLG